MFNFQDMRKVILIIILVIVVQLSTLPGHQFTKLPEKEWTRQTQFSVGYFSRFLPKALSSP